MAEIESIFSIIILFIVSFTAFFIFNTFYLSNINSNYQQNLELDKYKYNENKLETLLLLDDPYSKSSFFLDSVNLILNNTHYSTTQYGMISRDLWYKKQLDNMFGEDNYYFNFDYKIDNLSMIFLYDDGGFIRNIDNSINFKDILVNIYDEFESLGVNFKSTIYILTKNSSSNECTSRFNNIRENLDCNLIVVDRNQDYEYMDDPYSHFYSNPPADVARYISENYEDYALNDWANFVLQVLKKDYDGMASLYVDRITVFYFSDVVNLGYPINSITKPYLESKFAKVCEEFTPTDYSISDYGVNFLKDYLNNSYFSVFPIMVHDTNANLAYPLAISYYWEDILHQTYPGGSYCQLQQCSGCTGEEGHITYHPESWDKHEEQLEKIANASLEGELITYVPSLDLSTLINNYMSSILDKTYFSIGTKKNEDKQIIEKSIFVNVNGKPVKFNIYLEVYNNYNFTGNLDYIAIS